jgi:hypothetical protein
MIGSQQLRSSACVPGLARLDFFAVSAWPAYFVVCSAASAMHFYASTFSLTGGSVLSAVVINRWHECMYECMSAYAYVLACVLAHVA